VIVSCPEGSISRPAGTFFRRQSKDDEQRIFAQGVQEGAQKGLLSLCLGHTAESAQKGEI
jgi:hypothetical protein